MIIRLLVILTLIVQPLSASALTGGVDLRSALSNGGGACCGVVIEKTCCGHTVVRHHCGATADRCMCGVRPTETPRPLPKVPAPRTGDSINVDLPRETSVQIGVPDDDALTRGVVRLERLPTSHNVTQALFGIWRT